MPIKCSRIVLKTAYTNKRKHKQQGNAKKKKKMRLNPIALSLILAIVPTLTMHNTSQTQLDVVSYLNVPRLYV